MFLFDVPLGHFARNSALLWVRARAAGSYWAMTSSSGSTVSLTSAAGSVGLWVQLAVPQSVIGGGQFVNVAFDSFEYTMAQPWAGGAGTTTAMATIPGAPGACSRWSSGGSTYALLGGSSSSAVNLSKTFDLRALAHSFLRVELDLAFYGPMLNTLVTVRVDGQIAWESRLSGMRAGDAVMC